MKLKFSDPYRVDVLFFRNLDPGGSHRAMFFNPVGVRAKTRLSVGLRGDGM